LKIVVLVFISWAYSGALANFDTSVIPDSWGYSHPTILAISDSLANSEL
jgi:hypothetical protein